MNFSQGRLFLLVLGIIVNHHASFAQEQQEDFNTPNKRGSFYIFWGWNLSNYSKSNIHFTGENYDFVLQDVIAHDSPTDWDASIYLNPALMSVPQTNFKIGYFINDHWSISAGVDHMKYVMVQNQTVKINGYINDLESPYNGVYNDSDMIMTPDFLQFEHTDGLNYINTELNHFDDLLILFGKGMKNLEINILEGVGMGVLVPKTNSQLMNKPRNDDFHFAGYGINLKLGINITLYKIFFVQSEFKGGFIHMPDIRTTTAEVDRGSQAFTYLEGTLLIGARFRFFKRKN